MIPVRIEGISIQVILMTVGKKELKNGAIVDGDTIVHEQDGNYKFSAVSEIVEDLKPGDNIGLVAINLSLKSTPLPLFITKEPDKQNKILMGKFTSYQQLFTAHFLNNKKGSKI